jgi:hypothetical protein
VNATTSTGDGYVRIVSDGPAAAVTGSPRFFKGYRLRSSGGDAKADGTFVEWDWNGRVLSARTCVSGFVPLYYYRDSRQIVLSTRIEDIFTASSTPPRLCHAALGLLLRLGFLLGNGTVFKDVFLLGPNGSLSWEPDGAFSVQHEYLGAARVEASRDRLLHRYVDLFREAMAEIVPTLSEDFGMPLSGGRDSRHIALELFRAGLKPKIAVTSRMQHPRNDEDARIASGLCRLMDWRHAIVDQPTKRRLALEGTHARLTDFCSFEHSWTLAIRDALALHGVTEVFDGLGGDVLSAGLFQVQELVTLYRARDFRCLASQLLAQWQPRRLEHTLRPFLGEPLRAVLDPEPSLALIEDELRIHQHQPNPLKAFYFWNRSRRGAALLPFKILNRHVVYAPYLHRSVLTFLLGLDDEVTRSKTFHSEAICLADPTIGSVPYEDKSATVGQARPPFSFYGPLIAASMTSTSIRSTFVGLRATKALLTRDEKHARWWGPKRVAFLIFLERFIDAHK